MTDAYTTTHMSALSHQQPKLLTVLMGTSIEAWLLKRTNLPIRESIAVLVRDLRDDVKYVATGGRSARRVIEREIAGEIDLSLDLPRKEFMRAAESIYMNHVLAEAKGSITEAARIAGMPRTTATMAIRRLQRDTEEPKS